MSAPRERKPGEVVFTILLVVVSAFLMWQAFGISGFQSVSSAGMFPMLAGLTMTVTAVVVLVDQLKGAKSTGDRTGSRWATFRSAVLPREVMAGALAVLAYMLLLESLGFLLSSYLFLVLAMRLFGSRRWILNLVVSAASLGIIHLVFRTVFSVVLPKGSLWAGLAG